MNETGIDVFLNVSVNFPEINFVKYEYNKDLLIIELTLAREITTEQEEQFIKRASRCINLLHDIENTQSEVFSIKFSRVSGLTFLRYYRHVKYLGKQEINLLMSLIREDFYDCLIECEENPVDPDFFYKKIKRDLKEKLDKPGVKNYLFAYRDNGKLCMFNR